MTVNGQPPMVDEQTIIRFLRQLERAWRPPAMATTSSDYIGSP